VRDKYTNYSFALIWSAIHGHKVCLLVVCSRFVALPGYQVIHLTVVCNRVSSGTWYRATIAPDVAPCVLGVASSSVAYGRHGGRRVGYCPSGRLAGCHHVGRQIVHLVEQRHQVGRRLCTEGGCHACERRTLCECRAACEHQARRRRRGESHTGE
jgi:hypothetical protein